MEASGYSLHIALISEKKSVIDEFKSIVSKYIPKGVVRVLNDLNSLTENKTLFHSTDLCFIQVSNIDTISTHELKLLAEYASIYALGDHTSDNALQGILDGYITGISSLTLLPATLSQHLRSMQVSTAELHSPVLNSRFYEHFQSIADNMLSGVVRVLDKKNGDREVLFSNAGYYSLFEVDREAVEHDFTVVMKMLHPDDATLDIHQILKQIKRTGKAVHQYFRIITPTKKLKWIHLISNATETDDGDILHDFIVTDITDQKRKEQFFKEISKVSVNGGWDLDLISETLFWTDETKNIHEVPPDFHPTKENVLTFYQDEDSLVRVVNCFEEIHKSGTPFDERFQIVTAKGNKKWVRMKAKSESVNGNIVRIYGIFQDITDLVQNETKLMNSITEKSALLGEIHHRVKNNLAIISGLLQLELMKGADSRFSLKDAVNRIQSIATVHEILYSTDNFTSIDIEQYINKLVSNISGTYPKLSNDVDIYCEIEQVNLSINQSVPLGLLQNELITNSVKHAFNNTKTGFISIDIHQLDEHTLEMNYKDSGIGFNKDKLDNSNSLGFTLIQTLLDQLEASYDIETFNGFHLSCTFPIEKVDQSIVFS